MSTPVRSRLLPLFVLSASLCWGAPVLPTVQPQADSCLPGIAKYLNPGGVYYMGMDTRQWSATLDHWLGVAEKMIQSQPAQVGAKEGRMLLYFARAFARDSGFRDLAGVGASSVKVADDMYHNRVFLLNPAGASEGLLWETFSAENRPLDLLERLPRTTAYAQWAVVKPAPVWRWVRTAMANCGQPEIARSFEAEIARAKAQTGMDIDRLLQSLTGGVGVVVTLDPTRTIRLPIGPGGMEQQVPYLGAAVLLEVSNSALFDTLAGLVQATQPQARRVDKNGLCAYVLPSINAGGTGQNIQLTLASFGRYVVVGSSPQLVAALARRDGGLVSSPVFRSRHAEMPREGFAFRYLHPTAGMTLYEIIRTTAIKEGGTDAMTMVEAFEPLAHSFCFSVACRMPDGVLVLRNQNSQLSSGPSFGSAAVTVPILAGMLLPALAQAREKARRINELNNLKQVGMALVMYSTDHGGRFPDDLGALLEGKYVADGKLFVSPSAKTRPPTNAAELRAGQCDFLYFGKGRSEGELTPEDPIACSKPGVHKRYFGVLYSDGHVKGLSGEPPEALRKLIDAAQAR